MNHHSEVNVKVHSRSFENVRERKDRKRNVLPGKGIFLGGVNDIRDYVGVREHHPLWLSGRSARVYESCHIIGLNSGREAIHEARIGLQELLSALF